MPSAEGSGGLQSMGLQRVRHDWATNTLTWCPLWQEHPLSGSRWSGPRQSFPEQVLSSRHWRPVSLYQPLTVSSFCPPTGPLSTADGVSVLCSRPSSGFQRPYIKGHIPHIAYDSLLACPTRPFWLLPLQLSPLLPPLQPWPPCCAMNTPGLKILAIALLLSVPLLQISPGLSSNATFPIRLLVTTLSSSLVILPASPFPYVLSLNST